LKKGPRLPSNDWSGKRVTGYYGGFGFNTQMMEHPDVNPFVDDKAWGAYLDEKRDLLVKFCEEN